MKKILCLDVGDVRIGIAISDALQITAQGLKTYERVGIKRDTTEIVNIAKENDVDTIVVGLNKKADGTESIQTQKVYEFKDKLENKIKSTMAGQIKVVFYDERFSTVMAEKFLIEADMRREKRKTVIDKVAAVIILQDYLDHQKAKQKRENEYN